MEKRRRKGTGSISYRTDRNCYQGVLRVGGKRRFVSGHDRETVERRLEALRQDPDMQRITLSERVSELEDALAEARSALAHYLESRRAPIPQVQRYRIIARDGPRCGYCGVDVEEAAIILDHITPWSKGGRNTDDNLVVCCQSCNHAKGTKLPPTEWLKYRRPLERPIMWVP